MALLTALFSRLLSMALTALPVMAVVLLMRLVLRRAPRKYSYALWMAVGFRLVCPVSFERLWSIFQLPGLYDLAESTGAVGTGMVDGLPPVAAALYPAAPSVTTPAGTGGTVPTVPMGETAIPLLSEPMGMDWKSLLPQIGAVMWLLGVMAVLAVGMVSLVRLRKRLAGAVWRGGEVWESENVPTPFVLGFLRPRIYLPPGLTGTERTCVLVHERHHIRRLDPWWKLLGWCILAAYWWNPAVWLCWVLFCRDMEMSCDEAVLSTLGDQTKTGYSEALVSFALARRVPAALAFGEHDAARRVKNVLNWKKESPRIAFLAAAAVLLVVMACIGNPSARPDSGHVWGVEGEDGLWSLEYRFPEDTHSFVFYREVYRYGQLEDRSCMMMDGMAADGEGVTKPQGIFPLEIFREDGETGLRFSSATFSTLMPEAADSARLTEWSYLRGETELNLGGSAAVAAAYAPGEGTPPLECGELNREEPAALLRQYPVAVVLRLAVSRQSSWLELSLRVEGGSMDLPAVLYGLRLDRALEGDLPTLPLGETLHQDLSGVRTILETLGVPDLENCTLEMGIDPIGSGKGLCTLRVYCKAPADSAAFADAMTTAGKVVPALVGDVDQVMYGYMRGGGKAWFTPYSRGGPNDLDEMAQELGYRDIHALGRTLAGVQALVDDLWAEGLPSLSATDTLAQRLWAAREGSGTELENLLLNEGIPGVDGEPAWVPVSRRTITWTDEHTLSFRFEDPDPTAQEVQRAMEKKAVVLLAMRRELTQVDWTWAPVSGEGVSGQLTEAEADALLTTAGFTGGVKAMGASPTALAELLGWLESWGSSSRTAVAAAAALLEKARTATAAALAEELLASGSLGTGRWTRCSLEQTSDGALRGTVSGLMLTDGDWQTQRSLLEKYGILLLALEPALPAVRWTDAAGQWNLILDRTRTDNYLMEFMGPDTRLDDLGASAEALADFLAFLPAADTATAAAARAEPFTDVLGYDGVAETHYASYGYRSRTYYAAVDGVWTPIARSCNWGELEEYAVDLDGDGREELIANVMAGDGARSACVYQRRSDGVYLGTHSADGFPDFYDWGINASWSEYDPAEDCFRFHYCVAPEEYAEITYRGMEGLTFEPYTDPYAVDQALWLKTGA